jgi:hypothetical protein
MRDTFPFMPEFICFVNRQIKQVPLNRAEIRRFSAGVYLF